MKRLMSALIAATLAASPLAAQEGREWAVGVTAQNAWLLFGTPFSDNVVFRVNCAPNADTVALAYRLDPPQGQAGGQVPLKVLRSGVGQVLVGELSHLAEIDVYLVEATLSLDELRTLLEQAEAEAEAEVLVVATPGTFEELPVPPIEDAEAFLNACGRN